MAEDNFNIIKPVEGLQNLAGLNSVKRREERSRRQNLNDQQDDQDEQQPDDSSEQQDFKEESVEYEDGQHTIDYCA